MENIKKEYNENVIFENNTYEIVGLNKKNEKIKIRYFGQLMEKEVTDANKIYLYYGYGNLWNYKNNLEMIYNKNSKSYEISIEIIEEDSLYFCFMNEKNNWDLNGNTSYMLEIIKNIDSMSKSEKEILDINESDNSIRKFFKQISKKFFILLNKLGISFNKSL